MTYEQSDLSVQELEAQAVIELPQRELLQRQQIVFNIFLFSAFGGGGGGGGGGGDEGAGGNGGDGGNASVLSVHFCSGKR